MAFWDSFTGKSAERKGRAIAEDMRREAMDYADRSRGALQGGVDLARRDLAEGLQHGEAFLSRGAGEASQQLRGGVDTAVSSARGALGRGLKTGASLYAQARGGFGGYAGAGATGLAGLQDTRNLEGLYDAARQRVERAASARGLYGSTKVPEYLADEYAQIASQEADRRQGINAQLAGMGLSAQGQMAGLYGQQAAGERGLYSQQAGLEADLYSRHGAQQADLLSSLYGDLGRGRLAYGQNLANLAYGGGQQMAGLYESEADRILGTRAGESQLVQARSAGNQALLGSGLGALGTYTGGGGRFGGIRQLYGRMTG